MSFFILMNCAMAGLFRGTFVSWWYMPRICPSVTGMQLYYHARYPTDDWHLAYVLTGIFSVGVCLVGVFPHSVSTRQIPASGVTRISTRSKQGAFELTYGSACIVGWWSGLLDSLISTYIVHFMRCVIGRIHYGLKIVFCFKHFTAFHYHHHTRPLMGIDHM